MTSALDEKLKLFRTKFIDEYDSSFKQLVLLWGAARKDGSKTTVGPFLFDVHKIKGTSGALSFSALSGIMGEIESHLRGLKTTSLPAQSIKFVDERMNELIAAARQVPNPMLLTEPQSQEAPTAANVSDTQTNDVTHAKRSKTVNLSAAEPTGSEVYSTNSYADIAIAVIDDDKAVLALITKLLKGFGFTVDSFNSIDDFMGAKNKASFRLLLLDLVMPNVSQAQVLTFAQQQENFGVRVYILSSLNTFDARLGSVRANVSDYLLKPVNITNVVSKIRKTFKVDQFEPHKIFLLDDQAAVGHFYKSLLENEDVIVEVLSDASKLMDTLENFHPDVFMLDMHMPNISGLEIARIIRQQAKFDYVPIVFLTADTEIKTKLLALKSGADDVIFKDTPPDMIVKQVETRILRGKQVRYLASRDSLTGLLNHGQIMEAARQAHRLSLRSEKPMIMAMIDVDHFKKVNDAYGHSGGDKVLVSLGQLLMQSIRSSDYVGRYGGEEFMLVFGDGDMASIETKVNELRESFNHLTFKIDDTSFTCSFSAGLASSQDYEKLSELISAADAALYLAKDKGRNTVCVDGDI